MIETKCHIRLVCWYDKSSFSYCLPQRPLFVLQVCVIDNDINKMTSNKFSITHPRNKFQ